MKSRRTDELSAALSESLGKRECFGVMGPHEVCVRAFWDAVDVSFAGDSGGIILFVALGEYQRTELKRALMGQKRQDCPQVQITTPQILEHLLAADGVRFTRMMALCRRIVVWLHPEDFRDSMLDYWLDVEQRMPNPNVAYLGVRPDQTHDLERRHPGMQWFSLPMQDGCCLPIVHYLDCNQPPAEMLDHSFWKTCKNRRKCLPKRPIIFIW